MPANSQLSIQCQLLCACGCAYNIVNDVYSPPAGDPFGPAIGWDTNLPVAVTGGEDNIDAALVGLVNINGASSVVIAFRGTLPPTDPVTVPEILDWWQDFMDEPVSTPNVPGQVHSGFLAAVNNVLPGIVTAVEQLQPATGTALPIFVTGHSKGGGMASISTALIFFNQLLSTVPAAVYTFASPYPGDANFVAGFPASIPVTRYENNLDIVPFLPPDAAVIADLEALPVIGNWFTQFEGWNYASLGTLYFINSNLSVSQQAQNYCWLEILFYIADGIAGGQGFTYIADAHSHLCGGGYMGGTCPSGVCPVTA